MGRRPKRGVSPMAALAPAVFVIGLEEGVFPHLRSLGEPSELEETFTDWNAELDET